MNNTETETGSAGNGVSARAEGQPAEEGFVLLYLDAGHWHDTLVRLLAFVDYARIEITTPEQGMGCYTCQMVGLAQLSFINHSIIPQDDGRAGDVGHAVVINVRQQLSFLEAAIGTDALSEAQREIPVNVKFTWRGGESFTRVISNGFVMQPMKSLTKEREHVRSAKQPNLTWPYRCTILSRKLLHALTVFDEMGGSEVQITVEDDGDNLYVETTTVDEVTLLATIPIDEHEDFEGSCSSTFSLDYLLKYVKAMGDVWITLHLGDDVPLKIEDDSTQIILAPKV